MINSKCAIILTMKKIFFLLLLLLPEFVSAYDACIDGIYYNLNRDTKEATVTYKALNSSSYSGTVNIPPLITYEGKKYSVTSIGENAFEGCKSLLSFTIPSSVTSIAYMAFADCSSLTYLSIPNSVTSIGNSAFKGCSSLTSVIIPNSMKMIYYSVFSGCSSLISVTIPSSVESIWQGAFYGCSSLTSVHISDLEAWCKIAFVTDWYSNPLQYAHHLFLNDEELKDLIIPNTVEKINKYAFRGCSSLTSLTLSNNLTSIGENAFAGCSGLRSVTVCSDKLSLSNAFPDSKSVEKLVYGEGCAKAVSTGLTSVSEVSLPTSLQTIDANAFRNFTNLKSVTIPRNVTGIGSGAFSGCSNVAKLVYADGCAKALSTGLKSVSEVSLPQTLQAIDANAFKNFTNLKSILIPANVSSIGDYAFQGCKSITSISIPKSVTNIPQSAFDGCTGLTSVGNISFCTSIGNRAFYGCSNLTDVGELPSCASIGSYGFYGCSSLTSLTLSNNLTSIGENAFAGCSGLRSVTVCSDKLSLSNAFPDSKSVEKLVYGEGCAKAVSTGLTSVSEVSLPTSLQTIDASAFANFTNLETITIPKSVTSIGPSAFSGCSGLITLIIPKDVNNIGNKAFTGCSSLRSVTICSDNLSLSGVFPDSKNVENLIYADGCTKAMSTGLTSVSEVSLPQTLQSIDAGAFMNFTNLETIFIPKSVTSIGENAFSNCSGLTSVHISDLTAWCQISFSKSSSGNSYSNPACMAHHLFLNGEEIKDLVIPSNVNSISNLAFWACHGLTSVTIPGNVKSIGQSAFASCQGLTSANIENGVTDIENWAFYNCKALATVNIGSSVTNIGDGAFNNCVSLNSVTIPRNVTKIGNKAFAGCSGLSSVTVCTDNLSLSGVFPDSKNVEKLIYGEGCTKAVSTGLTSVSEVVLPKTLQTIDANTFYNFRNLKEITIPQSVASIGENAFYGCSNLASVKVLVTDYSDFCTNKIVSLIKSRIGKPVMLIDENGNEIKDFRIPEGVTTVGEYAFCNCSGLTSVLIPSSVTSISQQAFSGCNNVEKLIYGEGCTKAVSTGLTSVSEVVLPKTLQTIDASAFYNFKNLKTITIPQSVTSIGQQAFYGCAALASVIIENNNLTEIYQNAFPSQAKLYVKRGTKTLLTLWKNGYTRPYEIGTDKQLPPSSLSVVSTTQMTATIKVNDFYDGYAYTFNDEKIGKDTKTLSVPYPGYKFNQPLKISLDDVLYTANPYSFQTKGLNMKAERTGGTASSMTVKASYEHGDAPATAQTLSLGGVTVEDDEIYLNGLKPNTSYTVTYTIITDGPWMFQQTFKFSTNALKFTASQPKVISEGNVIIASKSNLDEGETNVGFEWRRTDWTSEFPSNRAGAYLYEGMMEGYIRNLNTNYLWKYRPYYETQDGSRYYGEWTGIDPTNTSYFEPTVHTYDKVEVNGNRARVKGYAMRGSDNIVSQGFRYWRSTESASRAKQVEADGQVMSIELKGLDYHTTYRVVAFVTTSEVKTYYGKEQLFTTGDPTGIEETFADEPKKITEEGIYDLSGRKLERMQKGINIIRKADGTTKKVLVK